MEESMDWAEGQQPLGIDLMCLLSCKRGSFLSGFSPQKGVFPWGWSGHFTLKFRLKQFFAMLCWWVIVLVSFCVGELCKTCGVRKKPLYRKKWIVWRYMQWGATKGMIWEHHCSRHEWFSFNSFICIICTGSLLWVSHQSIPFPTIGLVWSALWQLSKWVNNWIH